jgi:hypothetical protein
MRWVVGAMVLLLLAPGAARAQDASPLPAIPGLEEAPPPPPLPGSAEVGKNPLNAAHLDTMMLVEGLAAGGAGIAAGYERSFGTILGVEAEAGYLGAADRSPTAPRRLDVVSVLAGVRLSLLQTAVNGPSLGLAAGPALAWFAWSGQNLFFVWPQIRIDVAMKLSLGRGARGPFVEPRFGYRLVLQGGEAEGMPIPWHGGLTGGLRAGWAF